MAVESGNGAAVGIVVGFALLGLVWAFISAKIWQNKGGSFGVGFALGFFLGVIGLLIVALRQPSGSREPVLMSAPPPPPAGPPAGTGAVPPGPGRPPGAKRKLDCNNCGRRMREEGGVTVVGGTPGAAPPIVKLRCDNCDITRFEYREEIERELAEEASG